MRDVNTRMVVAGVNFHKTSLQVRSKFALTTEHIKTIYTDVDCGCLDDFFILSTCNRTEIYSTSNHPKTLLNLLAKQNDIDANDIDSYSFVKEGHDAIKHLYRVASGLDSQILGDYEIIGQLKNAFALAKEHNRTNGFLEKVVNSSLQASRQVKKRTSLSDGTTSVSYATIQLLKQLANNDKPLHICLLGLGKIGTLTLKNLKNYLPQHQITVVNRNEAKAQSTANEYGVNFEVYSNQQQILANADVLIVATGADNPIITKQDIEKARVNLIFDLSVPSNVAADVTEIEGVNLYNIDTLSEIVNNTIMQRRNELPLAENIIEEHFEEFKEWEEKRAFYKMKEADQKHIQNELINKIGNYENHTNCDQNKPACSLADQCCNE